MEDLPRPLGVPPGDGEGEERGAGHAEDGAEPDEEAPAALGGVLRQPAAEDGVGAHWGPPAAAVRARDCSSRT